MKIGLVKKGIRYLCEDTQKINYHKFVKDSALFDSKKQNEILDAVKKEMQVGAINEINKVLDETSIRKVLGKFGSLKKDIKHSFDKLKNQIHLTSAPQKAIPEDLKVAFTGLKNKTGQDFVDCAYNKIVGYMKLDGVAPKSINITKEDGMYRVTGGYNPVTNAIEYSKGFMTKLTKEKQIKLLSHELKHCEQFNNILRTEGITIEDFARAIAQQGVRASLDKDSLSTMFFRFAYEDALKQGKGEEFIQKAIEDRVNKLVPELKNNFAQTLSMPKIKANSPEGIKAHEHLEAMRNYEGLDFLGFGGKEYYNNPLEKEAYAFGDEMEIYFKKFKP